MTMDKVVAQGSKPAVSQGFQPAAAKSNVPVGSDALPIWKSAIRQVWKPWFGNLRYGRIDFVNGPDSEYRELTERSGRGLGSLRYGSAMRYPG